MPLSFDHLGIPTLTSKRYLKEILLDGTIIIKNFRLLLGRLSQGNF